MVMSKVAGRLETRAREHKLVFPASGSVSNAVLSSTRISRHQGKEKWREWFPRLPSCGNHDSPKVEQCCNWRDESPSLGEGPGRFGYANVEPRK